MMKYIVGAFLQWLTVLVFLIAVMFFQWNILIFSVLAIWILLGPVTAIVNIWLKNKVKVTVKAVPTTIKNKEFTGILTAENESLIPIMKMICRIVIENKLTGENKILYFPINAIPKERNEKEFQILSKHCGYMEIKIDKIWLLDWFGFLPMGIETDIKAHMSVLPDTFPSQVCIDMSFSKKDDTLNWSPVKMGKDQSEIFSLREYVKGDSIKHIHWKLSAKKRQMIVKEGSLPIDRSILVFWDKNAGHASEDEMDVMAECVSSVCQGIAQQAVTFVLGWTEKTEAVYEYIDSESRLLQTIPQMMKHGSWKEGMSDRNNMVRQNSYSKEVVFAVSLPEDHNFDSYHNKVYIICDKPARQEKNNMIFYGTDSYREDLAIVQI